MKTARRNTESPRENKLGVHTRSRAKSNLRTQVAQAAARLIADGLNDYRAAKRKAATGLGVVNEAELPDDAEVEAALHGIITLFTPGSPSTHLLEMREAALFVMEKLSQFSPWLVGPVLRGTATVHSPIEFHLTSTSPKLFEMFLLEEGLRYEVKSNNAALGPDVAQFVFEAKGQVVSCTVFPECADGGSRSGRNKPEYERVRLAEARKRFRSGDVDT